MESSEQTSAKESEQASDEESTRHQATVATDRQEAITGDPGFGDQQPRTVPHDPDAVHATSAPPLTGPVSADAPEQQTPEQRAATHAAEDNAPMPRQGEDQVGETGSEGDEEPSSEGEQDAASPGEAAGD